MTIPVEKPCRFAASSIVPHGVLLFGSTPIAPLYVFNPQLNAVAPAAESVTREDEERVYTETD